MKKLKLILNFSIFLLVLFSCGTKIRKEDNKYIPYKGNEILVFQSNKNELDTIFLTGISKFNACYDPLSLFKPACEGKELSCKKSVLGKSDKFVTYFL